MAIIIRSLPLSFERIRRQPDSAVSLVVVEPGLKTPADMCITSGTEC